MTRLDRALAARGLARSRTHAQSLISDGAVRVDGVVVTRASLPVSSDAAVTVDDAAARFVSRGAHKLMSALDAFAPRGLAVAGRTALDVGASTGGFTQVLLERGAIRVTAVDVGHGQLDPSLAGDPRVDSREGVNVRDLPPPSAGEEVGVIVGDLSFISLRLVLAPVLAWLADDGDALLMIKPQFEVGKGRLGRGGVVTDRAALAGAVADVCAAIADEGLGVAGIARSGLSGPRGTVEFFVWARRTWQAGTELRPLDAAALTRAIESEVNRPA